ncbi:MAG: MFS transporter [Bacillota bacterium]
MEVLRRDTAGSRRVPGKDVTRLSKIREAGARTARQAQRAGRAFASNFNPLRERNLRIYLSGQAVSLMGTWMQNTAQSWVVWELSRSEAALGLVAMIGSLPLLILSPWTGVWADRLNRRRVLIGTQTMAMLLAFTLALLVQTHTVQLWHVYALAFGLGIVGTLDFPSQQAFIGDLAGLTHVRQAVVVNAMIVQLSRMLGPSLAGWVVGTLGTAPAFWVNGASFLAVIGSLLAVRSHQVTRRHEGGGLSEFAEGLRFIAGRPRIQDLLAFTFLFTLFGISNMQLMPAIATDVLGRGPEALGLLLGASGAGALVSALIVVPIGQRLKHTGLMLAVAVAWSGAAFLMFSFSRYFPLSVATLFLTGLTGPLVLTTANGLIQTLAPVHMRARIISTWLMVGFGMQPLAGLLVGTTGKLFGASVAVSINALAMLTGALALVLFRPGLREWSASLTAPPPAAGPPTGPAGREGPSGTAIDPTPAGS